MCWRGFTYLGATEADLGSRWAPLAHNRSPCPIAIFPVEIPFVSPPVSTRTFTRDDEALPRWALLSGGEGRVRHVITEDGQGITDGALEHTMSCWMEGHGCFLIVVWIGIDNGARAGRYNLPSGAHFFRRRKSKGGQSW